VWVQIASGLGRGEAVEVDDEPITIGSGEGCRLRVPDAGVAALHASIRREDDGTVTITALSAGHPVTLDGEVVEHTAPLREGAEIALADVCLSVGDQPPGPAAEERAEQLAAAAEEVEGPRDVEPVAGVRRRVRLATALAGAALAAAVVLGVLAVAGTFSSSRGFDAAQVAARARPSTVRVDVSGPGIRGRGTGWVLDAGRGLIVTNFHVVNGATTFTVVAPSGSYDAGVVAAAPCDDIAVLHVARATGLRTMALGSQRDLHIGDQVAALGFPINLVGAPRLTTTAGVVSVVSATLASQRQGPGLKGAVQTDAAINPGNSGGPLLDGRARLVGMNTEGFLSAHGEPIQNQGYAVGVDRMRQLLPGLARGHSRGWAGFSFAVPPQAFLTKRRLPAGLIAGAAVAGTPAARAGLEHAQVLLVSIAGRRVGRDVPSYCAAVAGAHGTVPVGVIARAGGRPRTLRMSFG
jgi:S1-C subfamily serine protease